MNRPRSLAVATLAASLIALPACGSRDGDSGGGGNPFGGDGGEGEGESPPGTEGEGEDPDGDGGDGGGGGGQSINVEDLQDEESPDHPAPGATVQVSGVIIAGPNAQGRFHLGSLTGGPLSGVYVYNPAGDSQVDVSALAVGAAAKVTGEFKEYSQRGDDSGGTLTEIVLGSVSVTGTADVPTPASVEPSTVAAGAGAEPYEGALIDVGEVTVTTAGLAGGRFVVTGDLTVGNLYHGFIAAEGQALGHLRGVLHYESGVYHLCPRSADDIGGAAADLPTYAIRDLQDPNREGPAERAPIRLSDAVVTAGPDIWDNGTATFFIQEPAGGQWSGIYIYRHSTVDIDVSALAIGDAVSAEGELQEFTFSDDEGAATVTELYLRALDVAGNRGAPEPADVPAADLLSADTAEPWEGVLIRVSNVTVDSVGQGTFTVAGGLVVGDTFHHAAVQQGQSIESIVGVLHFESDEYRLLPRSADDIR